MIINWLAEYLFSLVEIYMNFMFFEAFFKKSPRANKLFYTVASAILAVVVIALNSIKLFSLLNTAVFFIIFCLINVFTFKANPIKIVGCELTYFAILFLTGTIPQTILAQKYDMTAADVSGNFSIARTIGGIISSILLAIICIGINKLIGNKKPFNKKAFALGMIGTVILTFLSVVIYYELAANLKENNMIALLFFLMLALLLSTFIAFIFFLDSQQNKQENELIRRQNQYLERSLTEQESMLFLWRQSIHDYKNAILTLDSYIEQNRLNELIDHIHSEKAKFEQSPPFFRTGNSTIDTIINTKHATARKKKIHFSVNAKMPEKCAVSDIHLAVMLGNLLDNAIESQGKEDQPFISVQITTAGELLIIKIINKCGTPPENNETTKKDRLFHGIGIKSVEKTVRQYDGDFSLKYENGTAVVMVIIPNKI